MRMVLMVLLAALVAGCEARQGGAPVPEPAPVPPADTATRPDSSPGPSAPREEPATPREDPASPRNVILESPAAGSSITTNPVTVSGRARTFENNVGLRLEDSNGRVIARGFTTATGEMGTFSPFSSQMFITIDPGRTMKVVAFETSAKDGSIRSSDEALVRVTGAKKMVRLYFPNSTLHPNDCTAVEPIVRNLPVSISAARLAIEALIGGPTQPERAVGLSNPFPEGSAMRSINLRNGVVTVDFNERLSNVGGSCRAQSIRVAVEKTLLAVDGVNRVVITAMGRESTALQP